MQRYRLFFTLTLSFALHFALLAFLIFHQKNLGFKKGIGEHKIKASFLTLSDTPSSALKSPLKPQPLPKTTQKIPTPAKKTPPQPPKKVQPKPIEKTPQKKIQQPQEQLQQPQKSPPQENQAPIEEEIQQPTPSLEQTLQTPLENLATQDSFEQENTQEQTPPLPFEKTLAYQLADTYTKKNIAEIYGLEFGHLGREEQDFIINNLSRIGMITQSYLRYPANAGMLKQEGMNVVEFYLHPNGDISDLKIINSSGFILLDRNSTRTIEIAYKDYPRPKVKTLIRFYISYIMRPY